MTGKAIFLLRSPAIFSSAPDLIVALQALCHIEGVVFSHVFVWVVTGTAGESFAAREAAAGHQTHRLKANVEGVVLLRPGRDVSRLGQPVTIPAQLNDLSSAASARVFNRSRQVFLACLRGLDVRRASAMAAFAMNPGLHVGQLGAGARLAHARRVTIETSCDRLPILEKAEPFAGGSEPPQRVPGSDSRLPTHWIVGDTVLKVVAVGPPHRRQTLHTSA